MFTEIVRFTIPEGLSREAVLEGYEKSARTIWRECPDLIRKNYLLDMDARVGGGVYLWRRREDAAKWHGEAFRTRIRATFGVEPVCELFETPVLVDNMAGEVVTG